MRTLNAALLTELGKTITKPGYLIEIGFSTELRLSTLGTLAFNSFTWTATDVLVQGITTDEKGNQSGSLVFNNTLNDLTAVVFNEGVADRPVKIWACYADAPSVSVQVFDGVGDDVDIDNRGKLSLRLATSSSRTAFWPRRRINAASGFLHLLPDGTAVTMAGQTVTLERR